MSWWRLIVAGAALALLVTTARAQTGSVRVLDPDGVLSGRTTAIQEAGVRLAAQGADVIVVAAGRSGGTDAASADAYLDAVLAENNLAPAATQLEPDQIVFFVARDARRTALRFGQRWIATMGASEQTIQQQQMNPRFAQGDFEGGLVAGITAATATIDPPTPRLVYLLGGALLVTAIGLVAWPMLRRRQATQNVLDTARDQTMAARRAAGAAIADLGQLVRDAEAKQQYDRYSYSANDAATIEQRQADGMRLFEQAQAAFDAAEEQTGAAQTLTPEQYQTIVQQYAAAHKLAHEARTAISAAEAMRSQFDARPPASTAPTERLDDDQPAL